MLDIMDRTTSLPRYAAPQIAGLPFEIPTKDRNLSSGFPYTDQLVKLHISPQEWLELSNTIVRASQISKSQHLSAFAAGVGVGVLTPISSTAMSVFGSGPGYAVSRAVRNKALREKVESSLKDGELKAIFRFWNETKFRDRGFYAELVLRAAKGTAEATGTEGSDGDDDSYLETMSVSSKRKMPWDRGRKGDQSGGKKDSENDSQETRKVRYILVLRPLTDVKSVSPMSPTPVIGSPLSELPGDSLDSKFDVSSRRPFTAELEG